MEKQVSSPAPATILLAGLGAARLIDVDSFRAADRIILIAPDSPHGDALASLPVTDKRLHMHSGVLGAKLDHMTLHVMNFSYMNSIYPPTQALFCLFPGLKEIRQRVIDVLPIQNVLDLERITHPFLVAIDSPGIEMDILDSFSVAGAMNSIDQLVIKCGTKALYRGATSCAALECRLAACGLTIWKRDIRDPDLPVIEFRQQEVAANAEELQIVPVTERSISNTSRHPNLGTLSQEILAQEWQRADMSKTLSDLRRETARMMEEAKSEVTLARKNQQLLHNDLVDLRKRYARSVRSTPGRLLTETDPITQPVRMLHHLACTGGTVLSKCVAALPNVLLLSEVDPLSTMAYNPANPTFQPTDLIKSTRYADRTCENAVLLSIFHGGLAALRKSAQERGQHLVLRDHNHSHFCVKIDPNTRPTLREIMSPNTRLLSVVTLRHPVDSYLSLVRQGWNTHMHPATIEEYSSRYLAFLNRHQDCPRLRYEDFLSDPATKLADLCNWLELPFNTEALTLFPVIRMSGDSGRGGDVLTHRKRRAISALIGKQIEESQSLRRLCDMLEYSLTDL